MQLTHSFRVPVPVEQAWATLRDIERVAPCMPGATIDSVDGEEFTGRVKVKVGPITVTYRGEARFVDVDEANHRASIEAAGKETKGSGTARATVRAELRADGDETEVTVDTDLAVTGRPAQFGRGVMADVGGKLIGQFADCLSSRLAGGELQAEAAAEPATAAASAASTAISTEPVPAATGQRPPAGGPGPVPTEEAPVTTSPRPVSVPQRESDDAIDLLGVAGAPLAKRLAPVAGGLLGLILLWLLGTRRHARRKVSRLTARLERVEGTAAAKAKPAKERRSRKERRRRDEGRRSRR